MGRVQCKQRPEDPDGILSPNHRAAGLSHVSLFIFPVELMGRCGADFELSGVKVLQQGIGTMPAVIGGDGGGEPGAKALISRPR